MGTILTYVPSLMLNQENALKTVVSVLSHHIIYFKKNQVSFAFFFKGHCLNASYWVSPEQFGGK